MKVRCVGQSGNAALDPCFNSAGMPVGPVRLHRKQPGERE